MQMFLGTKLFKEQDEDFDIVRIVKIYNPTKFKIMKESTGETLKITDKELSEEGYKVLEPIGILTFNVVTIGKNKDVVVTMAKMINVKAGVSAPSVICRQSVTDFFYNLLAEVEDHGYVGVSVSESTCPSNINYGEMLACDDIDFSEIVSIYYDDTIDSVMNCISLIRYNDVLWKLYDKHVASTSNQALKLKNEDMGWCKRIDDLLKLNNFWIDVDAAFNITDVDFDIENYIIEKKDEAGKEYNSLNSEALRFFSSTFKINMVDSIITEYYYDIDLGEYRNENYVMIRSNNGKLYLMVYLVQGTYLEQDMAIVKEKEDLSHILGLKIVDKYKTK